MIYLKSNKEMNKYMEDENERKYKKLEVSVLKKCYFKLSFKKC